MKKVSEFLTVTMNKIADFVGHPVVFTMAVLVIAAWFVSGMFLEYDTWFDIMDVTIFITTFFLLFVIQASQNADTKAIQDKLDDIIEALPHSDKVHKGEEKEIKKGKKTSR